MKISRKIVKFDLPENEGLNEFKNEQKVFLVKF